MQSWKSIALTYLSGMWLYRWYALGIAWVLCLIGWAAIAALPDQYQAEAKVYIDTDNVVKPLLRGLTVSVDTDQQIAVMLKTLITRPNLEQVIHLTDPKTNALTAAQLEQQVQALENKISVRFLGTKNFYAIAYTDNSSDYALSVTNQLLSILQNSNIGNQRLNMDDARSFIEKRITEYQERLREADRRRADFKTLNMQILGKGDQSTRIDAVEKELAQANKDLNAAVARRDSVQGQVATTPKTVPYEDRIVIVTAGGDGNLRGDSANNAQRSSALQRLQQSQQTLSDLRTKYTDAHPEVIALQRLIAQLKADVSETPPPESPPANSQSPGVPNPVYTQLNNKLADEEANVAVQRQRVAAAQTELSETKRTTSSAIDILTKYADLDRDYGNIEKTYQELIQSRESANLSQAVNDQNQGLAFRVVEPPQKPQRPAAPYRLVLNSLALLAGLIGGAACGVLLALISGRFITSDNLSAQFDIPIIGVVSRFRNSALSSSSMLPEFALATSVALLFFCYVGVVIVFDSSIYSVLGV